MEHRLSALLQLHLHSRLNIWLQGIRQISHKAVKNILSVGIWCILYYRLDGSSRNLTIMGLNWADVGPIPAVSVQYWPSSRPLWHVYRSTIGQLGIMYDQIIWLWLFLAWQLYSCYVCFRHIGWGHFPCGSDLTGNGKWGHPRWWPEAERPPFSTIHHHRGRKTHQWFWRRKCHMGHCPHVMQKQWDKFERYGTFPRIILLLKKCIGYILVITQIFDKV